MSNRHPLIRGALILTLTGFLTRIIGFFYRVFLSHTIGAKGLGLYHLLFPIQGLCMALTTAGIQTAISRFVAARSALRDETGANDIFLVGSGLSLILSLLFAVLLRQNAGPISRSLLLEPRCEPLLQVMALCLPLGTIHSCITSYYYARKKAEIPAILQLLEQLARVGSSWLVCQLLLSQGKALTPMIAVMGMFCGELASSLLSLLLLSLRFTKIHYHFRHFKASLSYLRQLLGMAAPLTANRVLLTLLTGAETILIPSRLRLFGLASEEALTVYGTLTGMALPIIFFPATITNAVSAMLLPSVAELQALGNQKKLRKTLGVVIRFCLLLGGICAFGFFSCSSFLGTILFDSNLASAFLRPLSFLCPFTYLNTTIASTLHGLGKTGICFLHNAISVSIRLAFVLLAIPVFGIQGYLWGVLFAELLLCLLNCRALFAQLGTGSDK